MITLFIRMIVSLSPLAHLNMYFPIFRSTAKFRMGKGDLEKAVPAGEHEVRPLIDCCCNQQVGRAISEIILVCKVCSILSNLCFITWLIISPWQVQVEGEDEES